MSRVAFVVYVNLDPVPGEFHSKESAQNALNNYLRMVISHYNPMVSLAPAELQPSDEPMIEFDAIQFGETPVLDGQDIQDLAAEMNHRAEELS